MPCKRYVSCSKKKTKKKRKLKQVRESCRKLALQIIDIYVGGAHHTIFATGRLLPSYATAPRSHPWAKERVRYCYTILTKTGMCRHVFFVKRKNIKFLKSYMLAS
jgi:hypothetical protein